MNIGILTFYRTENFGANLQALSTYKYIEKRGDNPICIYYISADAYKKQVLSLDSNVQLREHFQFVDKYMPNQTSVCHSVDDVHKVMDEFKIEAVIVGSDAVIQHHPLISRIYKGKRKPLYIEPVSKDRMYPNMFWGCGLKDNVKYALMSASSQNSAFKYFLPSLKKAMSASIANYNYVSVRDRWTQRMLHSITGKGYPLTPDPVFAFLQNCGDLVPSKAEILKKNGLPENYTLVSLMSQTLSIECLDGINKLFENIGVSCVSLPMPTGKGFKHNFKYSISEPLTPIDWYALIKYSYAYVGSNMHPIIVSLSNSVRCFSIDFWGVRNFWNRPVNDGSSKVEDILTTFNLQGNHRMIDGGICNVEPEEVFNAVQNFPKKRVYDKAKEMLDKYNIMMDEIYKHITE